MIFLLDNYDSFTYNLVQRLGEIDPTLDIRVERNDQITVEEIERLSPTHVIISPGPCTPNEAGISMACASHFAGRVPVLGVCLGHQSIGQVNGGRIERARHLMHGKTDWIHHDNQGLFAGLANPFLATRYHSLVIAPETVPPKFQVVGWSLEPDGSREVMAIEHRECPLIGWQFHPESFLTECGPELLSRFLRLRAPR
jgi:anthranilate synthase component 2